MRGILAVLAAAFALLTSAAADPPTLPALAAAPTFGSASLSPSGRYLAGINRDDKMDYLVVVDLQTRQSAVAQGGAHAQGLSIEWVEWKSEDQLVFSVSQSMAWLETRGAGSNLAGSSLGTISTSRIYISDRAGQNRRQLFEGNERKLAASIASTFLVDMLPGAPEEILIGAEGRGGLALFRVNLANGRLRQIDEGTWDTSGWVVDRDGNPVLRMEMLPRRSGYRVFRKGPGQRSWTQHIVVRKAGDMISDEFVPGPAGPEAGKIYVVARPEGQERASVYLFDAATGALGEPVYSFPAGDALADTVGVDRTTHRLSIACGYDRRLVCEPLDAGLAPVLSAVQTPFEGRATARIEDWADDKSVFLVNVDGPAAPSAYYTYTPATAAMTRVIPVFPAVRNASFAPTRTVDYKGRDGQSLWGYLTEPATGAGAGPLVVLPHGGPEARDYFEYDALVQAIALRGYRVFQPQFRGSDGFSRAFAEAGYHQWGQRMQDDIVDGVKSLVDNGVADPARICIVGASYGGYAALVGAMRDRDMFKCAVSIAGVSDLPAFLDNERHEEGRGSESYKYWVKAMGDPATDRPMLEQVSPARHAADIRAPVLLIHGDADDTVPFAQSELMQRAFQRAGRDVRLIRFEGRDHYLYEWPAADREKLFTEVDGFLDANIGASAAPH